MGAYEALTGRALVKDVEDGRVVEGEFLNVLRGVRLGMATPESRLQQWRQWTKRKAGGGKYEEKCVMARAFVSLRGRAAFHKVAAQGRGGGEGMEGAADLCPVHRLHHVPRRAALGAMASAGGVCCAHLARYTALRCMCTAMGWRCFASRKEVHEVACCACGWWGQHCIRWWLLYACKSCAGTTADNSTCHFKTTSRGFVEVFDQRICFPGRPLVRKRMTTGCGAQEWTALVAFAPLWRLRSWHMFWGLSLSLSPLVLFCELRQPVNASLAARQAAWGNWQLSDLC